MVKPTTLYLAGCKFEPHVGCRDYIENQILKKNPKKLIKTHEISISDIHTNCKAVILKMAFCYHKSRWTDQ